MYNIPTTQLGLIMHTIVGKQHCEPFEHSDLSYYRESSFWEHCLVDESNNRIILRSANKLFKPNKSKKRTVLNSQRLTT